MGDEPERDLRGFRKLLDPWDLQIVPVPSRAGEKPNSASPSSTRAEPKKDLQNSCRGRGTELSLLLRARRTIDGAAKSLVRTANWSVHRDSLGGHLTCVVGQIIAGEIEEVQRVRAMEGVSTRIDRHPLADDRGSVQRAGIVEGPGRVQ